MVVDPLHVPEQAGSPPHSARAGCAVRWGVPVTGAQVPIEPFMSQASHCPVQALSQQTPSTQLPFAHSPAVEQLWPLGLPMQVWLLQTGRFDGQSAAPQQWLALPLPPPVQMSTQAWLFGSHLVLAPQVSPQRPQLVLVPRGVSQPG